MHVRYLMCACYVMYVCKIIISMHVRVCVLCMYVFIHSRQCMYVTYVCSVVLCEVTYACMYDMVCMCVCMLVCMFCCVIYVGRLCHAMYV